MSETLWVEHRSNLSPSSCAHTSFNLVQWYHLYRWCSGFALCDHSLLQRWSHEIVWNEKERLAWKEPNFGHAHLPPYFSPIIFFFLLKRFWRQLFLICLKRNIQRPLSAARRQWCLIWQYKSERMQDKIINPCLKQLFGEAYFPFTLWKAAVTEGNTWIVFATLPILTQDLPGLITFICINLRFFFWVVVFVLSS